MSTRFYLSQFVQVTGPRGQTVWKPSISSFPTTAYSCVSIDTNTAGTPFGLVAVEAADHTPLLADPNSMALPALNLTDVPNAAHLASVQGALSRFGLPTSLPQSNTFGDVLRTVGQHFMPSFDEKLFARAVLP
jgi:hypothetical protein